MNSAPEPADRVLRSVEKNCQAFNRPRPHDHPFPHLRHRPPHRCGDPARRRPRTRRRCRRPMRPGAAAEHRVGGAHRRRGAGSRQRRGQAPGFSKQHQRRDPVRQAAWSALDPFWQAFVPRPTVGGSYNFGGRTSYAYIGATWTRGPLPRDPQRVVFLDGFFGGGAHNGYTGPKADDAATASTRSAARRCSARPRPWASASPSIGASWRPSSTCRMPACARTTAA